MINVLHNISAGKLGSAPGGVNCHATDLKISGEEDQ